MRPFFIAGNWKLNPGTLEEASQLASGISTSLSPNTQVQVGVFCPFVYLPSIVQELESSPVAVGAQTISTESSGAYTGEIAASMIHSIGATHTLIGHSERRQYHQETDQTVNARTKAAVSANLTPIVCIGETLEEREQNITFDVIKRQLVDGLADCSFVNTGSELVIAYEPVWAIGTGKVATPEQAQAVHAFIRQTLGEIFTPDIADNIVIQYGGSVKPENAKELLGQPDIDGALVGGASLKADSFVGIISAAQELVGAIA